MNLNRFWEYFFDVKEFLLIIAVLGIISAAVIPIMVRRFRYDRCNNALLCFLYGRNIREAAYISAVVVEVIFVISCILFKYNINLLIVAVIALLEIIIIVTGGRLKTMLVDIISSLFFIFSLFFTYTMTRYLGEIQDDKGVMVMNIALCILIICYSVFFLFWHMLQLGEETIYSRLRMNFGDNNDGEIK